MVEYYKIKTGKSYDKRVDYKVNTDEFGDPYGITYYYNLHNTFTEKIFIISRL